MDSSIIFDKVSFGYGSKPLFRDLSFAVAANKLTCLLGSTGCGKTSLLRLVAGLEVPKEGRIVLNGQTVSGPGIFVSPSERRVGFIFQDLALWPHFTVFRNVVWALKQKKIPDADALALDMLEAFNLQALADRYPHELSGGQKQLVALARALVLEPEILLMDEPLSNLDSKMKSRVLRYFRSLKDQFRITLVYVTHDHHDAELLADEIMLLSDDGDLVISGEKQQVLQSNEFRLYLAAE
ncbi:MAG: hypothetical protein KatS3mg031_1481 [Chitinophagales bacterium]|nr:MAG: hypothetical protein KatS3mg031_1481 [Chitinophagales bacterium]